MTEEKFKELLKQAELNATNDLLVSTYNYELHTLIVLQSINGGGAALLVSFLSKGGLPQDLLSKYFFIFSIISFFLGYLSSIKLLLLSPDFMMKRYKNCSSEDFKKMKLTRTCWIYSSVSFFSVAILLSVIALLLY